MTNGGHPKPKKASSRKRPAKPMTGAKAWATKSIQGKGTGKQ